MSDGGPTPETDALLRERREADLIERAGRAMRNCGTWGVQLACGGCGVAGPATAVPGHCSVRGCPRCDRRRAQELRRYAPAILADATPGEPLKLVTLTLPNVRELGSGQGGAVATLSRLYRVFRGELARLAVCRDCGGARRPRRSRIYCVCALPSPDPRARTVCEGCGRGALPWCACAPRETEGGEARRWITPAIGASLRSIEATYSRAAGWHPHVHVVARMPWVPQRTLAAVWSAVTARLWRAGPANGMGVDVRAIEAGPAALCEVLKYPTKMQDLNGKPRELAEWWRAVRGARLIQGTGAWARWARAAERAQLDELEIEDERAAIQGADGCDERPLDAWEQLRATRALPCACCGATAWRVAIVRGPGPPREGVP